MKTWRRDDETGPLQEPLELDVLGCRFSVDCRDAVSRSLIEACYAAFLTDDDGAEAIRYRVTVRDAAWFLECGDSVVRCPTPADLVYDFEKDMTIRVQLRRPELLFIHAAAVALDDRCVIIAGESGMGKSTLCWTLCNAGFEYLSDELAPIEPATGFVAPYPHALCLKARPSHAPGLPAAAIDLDRTLHVPVTGIPAARVVIGAKVAAIVFLERPAGGAARPGPQPVGTGEAAARLYANALNQSAHERQGLGAVRQIAALAPSCLLPRDEPATMVRSILQVLRDGLLAA